MEPQKEGIVVEGGREEKIHRLKMLFGSSQ